MLSGFHIFLDTIFFVTLAILTGYTVDIFFPSPHDETFIKSLLLVYLQISFGILFLYGIDQLYVKLMGRSSRDYFGINIYAVLFFLVQKQLGLRLANIFSYFNRFLIQETVF